MAFLKKSRSAIYQKMVSAVFIVISSANYIREIIEEVGCELWYLPAYSPDLNKIKKKILKY